MFGSWQSSSDDDDEDGADVDIPTRFEFDLAIVSVLHRGWCLCWIFVVHAVFAFMHAHGTAFSVGKSLRWVSIASSVVVSNS